MIGVIVPCVGRFAVYYVVLVSALLGCLVQKPLLQFRVIMRGVCCRRAGVYGARAGVLE